VDVIVEVVAVATGPLRSVSGGGCSRSGMFSGESETERKERKR